MGTLPLFGGCPHTTTPATLEVVVSAAAPLVSTRRSGRLKGRVVAVSKLASAQRDAMWSVFRTYYGEVKREVFEKDLAEKQEVILLTDSGDGSLQGFSTLQVYARAIDGRPFLAVFSGDTIVDEAYWGQNALQRTFARYLLAQKLAHPLIPVYWFLISKGYKTYLLLTRNLPNHWPRWDRETPAAEQAVLDLLATDKFGDAYVPEAGVLRFPECLGRLEEWVAPIEAHLLEHPDIAFFLKKNPGHVRGEELVCLARVDLAFPLHFAARQLRKSLRLFGRRLWGDATASS